MATPGNAVTGGGARMAAIRTLGCKVNSFESEQILEGLVQSGDWMPAGTAMPDLYIINSCTVTAEADRQTRQEIRRCIRENPNALVVVTGCYAQMDAGRCAAIDGVDLVVGNALKLKIPEVLRRFEAGLLPRVLTGSEADDLVGLPDPVLTGFGERARAFIQIQQGCDQGCTFCIIHKARGASRSLPASGIKRQIRRLLDAGFREFVLCGVDLGSWGRDLDDGPARDLVALLSDVVALDGDFRIRLGSLDPVHVTPELIALMSAEPRICPHLHISMQSGHTLILKRMKRRYDREGLYRAVLSARNRIPDLVVGADVMTGFPTEEEPHFEATRSAMRDLEIVFPHVFPYSERPGTPASRIPRQVPKAVRAARARHLREDGEAMLAKVLERFAGRLLPALIEHVDPVTGRAKGRLHNYLPVAVDRCDARRAAWAEVKITGHDGRVLHGGAHK